MSRRADPPSPALPAMRAGSWDWDLTAETVTCDAELCDMLGLDAAALDYRDWLALIPGDDRARVDTALQDTARTGRTLSITHRIAAAGGATAWVDLLARASGRDATGRAARVIGALRDITGSLPLPSAGTDAGDPEDRLADIADIVPGALMRYVVGADGLSRYDYLSPRCATLFEMSLDAIREDPKSIRRMFAPGDLEAFRHHYVDRADDPRPYDRKVVIETPSGIRKPLHVITRPRRMPGGTVVWTTLLLDTARQSDFEAEVARSRELLTQPRSSDAIGALSGGIAHDFNNLLTVILGNLELMREDGSLARRGAYVEEALQATRRGSELTRNLLSFARRATLHPALVDLNQVIRGLHAAMLQTLPDTVEVDTVLMGGLWPARLDRSLMESALLNLVANARDAMPDGGRLTIETANVRLDEAYVEDRQETIPPGRYVMVAVTDTGAGIPVDALEMVFEPYFTTKPTGTGTGLGLPSVLGFSKQSQGTTRIYSEPGVGTSVKMYFRAEDNAAETPQPRRLTPQADDGHRLRILLVEDEPAVRRVMRARLEAEGYEVVEAATGDEGYRRYFADGPFDLVITDIVMPGDRLGTGMIRDLRAADPAVKAIFVSGYPTEAAIHGGGVSQQDIQLMKPVSRDDLMRAIDKALRGGG